MQCEDGRWCSRGFPDGDEERVDGEFTQGYMPMLTEQSKKSGRSKGGKKPCLIL